MIRVFVIQSFPYSTDHIILFRTLPQPALSPKAQDKPPETTQDLTVPKKLVTQPSEHDCVKNSSVNKSSAEGLSSGNHLKILRTRASNNSLSLPSSRFSRVSRV